MFVYIINIHKILASINTNIIEYADNVLIYSSTKYVSNLKRLLILSVSKCDKRQQ